MNTIEKRKNQLAFIGAIILAIGTILAVAGIILLVTCKADGNLSILKLVFGIILAILGLIGFGIGLTFTWTARAVQATKGSIAEENLSKGTVNMHKCENCGAEVEEGKKICAKCEENLKP